MVVDTIHAGVHAWCSYVLVYVKARTILFEADLSLNVELRDPAGVARQ